MEKFTDRVNESTKFNEENKDFIEKSAIIEDLEERQRLIQSHMDAVKDNNMYSYALNRMYMLLEEIKITYK
jgi:hypothetical protein